MSARIRQKFSQLQAEGAKGLITYICSGDPDLETTAELVLALEEGGTDIVELGIPFSDPLADGPVIQRASQRALNSGTSVVKILHLVEDIRRCSQIPLVLMGYFNPILKYGVEAFVRDASNAGADGVIVPDLPVDEGAELYQPARRAGLAYIPLVAPTTYPERVKKIVEQADGFIYCVSLTGVTGMRRQLPPGLEQLTRMVRQYTSLPVAVGFGISSAEQARHVACHAEAVIVGSAVVKIIEEYAGSRVEMLRRVKTFTAHLKQALVG
ncbi:tryptophan synthase subunit alpha [Calderihabitans maritimus]|uniref:Tryptophan synthase alpha chain n=1 Tax=Calderihabitans maritimus TaxID=1246530 RepID=A0A1Z5HNF2_9FIRM|nr:tryptophan synthase subunit alpha [Calderihabitans maritimus]GAW90988.1 tryptophan synthase subunit alpha [Calderihabitans maritimus]